MGDRSPLLEEKWAPPPPGGGGTTVFNLSTARITLKGIGSNKAYETLQYFPSRFLVTLLSNNLKYLLPQNGVNISVGGGLYAIRGSHHADASGTPRGSPLRGDAIARVAQRSMSVCIPATVGTGVSNTCTMHLQEEERGPLSVQVTIPSLV